MNKYEIILNICESKSISKTAENLSYTQSAISQAVKSFEKDLGFPLFRRSKNGMELLPNTEGIIESLRRICEEEHKIRRIAADLTSLDSGYIRIGSIQSISYHWLPDILKDFSEKYPNIRFEVTIDGFAGLTGKLKKHQLDCAFISGYSAADFSFLPVEQDELMLVTPKQHRLAGQLTVSLADIKNDDFILSSDSLDYETGKLFELHHIRPKIRFHLNEDYAVTKMVEKGFGITILPNLLLQNTPFDVCVRSFTEHYTRVLGAAWPGDAPQSMAVMKFLDCVRDWSDSHAARD